MRDAGRRGASGLERLKVDRRAIVARLACEAESLIEGLSAEPASTCLSTEGRGVSYLTGNHSPLKTERIVDRRRRYERWMQRLAQDGTLVSVTRSVLLEAESFGTLDRRFRRRNGWARSQLIRALELLDYVDTSGA